MLGKSNVEWYNKPKEDMKYFLDTEFNDTGSKIDLISIALVNEMGRELCFTSSEFDVEAAYSKPWLVENVLPLLPPRPYWKTRKEIKEEIIKFLGRDARPQFWAWFAAYDWVAMCQLFGGMMLLPKPFPMNCMDLKQEHILAGSPVLPKQMERQHDCLEDAKWNRVVHGILMEGN